MSKAEALFRKKDIPKAQVYYLLHCILVEVATIATVIFVIERIQLYNTFFALALLPILFCILWLFYTMLVLFLFGIKVKKFH